MLYRNSYSLRDTLLSEAVIMPKKFFQDLEGLLRAEPSKRGRYGEIMLGIIEDSKDEEKRKASVKKKKAPSPTAYVTKTFSRHPDIIGIDNKPIVLSEIYLLYDVIFKFLEKKSEADFETCIKAADYFVKYFYKNMTAAKKSEFKKGEYDFENILNMVSYYERFLEKETGLSSLGEFYSKKVETVYEDDETAIFYPISSKGFLQVIREYVGKKRESLTWCTQSPITWYKYTYISKRFLFIAVNKNLPVNDPNYIISLKMDLNGEIKHEETCDRNNDYMTFDSVERILNARSKRNLTEFCLSYRENILRVVASEEVISEKQVSENILGLFSAGEYETIKDVMCALLYKVIKMYDPETSAPIEKSEEASVSNLTKAFVDLTKFIEKSDPQDKDDLEQKLAEILSDVYSDLIFLLEIHDAQDVVKEMLKCITGDHKSILSMALSDKAKDPDSHVRYYNALLFNDEIRDLSDPLEEEADLMLQNALSTKSTINFYNILERYAETTKKDEFFRGELSTIVKSRGFQNYLRKHKTGFLRNFFESSSEDLIISSIGANRGLFDEIAESVLGEGYEGIDEFVIILNCFLSEISVKGTTSIEKYAPILRDMSLEEAIDATDNILTNVKNFNRVIGSINILKDFALFFQMIYLCSTNQRGYPVSEDTFNLLTGLLRKLVSFESNPQTIYTNFDEHIFVFERNLSHISDEDTFRLNTSTLGGMLYILADRLGRSIEDVDLKIRELFIKRDIFGGLTYNQEGFEDFFNKHILELNKSRLDLCRENRIMFDKFALQNPAAVQTIAKLCIEKFIDIVESSYTGGRVRSINAKYFKDTLLYFCENQVVSKVINNMILNGEIPVENNRPLLNSNEGVRSLSYLVLSTFDRNLDVISRAAAERCVEMIFDCTLSQGFSDRLFALYDERIYDSVVSCIKTKVSERTKLLINEKFEEYVRGAHYKGKSNADEIISLYVDNLTNSIESDMTYMQFEDLIVEVIKKLSHVIKSSGLLFKMSEFGSPGQVEQKIADCILSAKSYDFKLACIRFMIELRKDDEAQFNKVNSLIPFDFTKVENDKSDAMKNFSSTYEEQGQIQREENPMQRMRARKRLQRRMSDSVNETILRTFIRNIIK